MNAIFSKKIFYLTNCTLFVTIFPCIECAKSIVASGLKRVVYIESEDENDDKDDGDNVDKPKKKKKKIKSSQLQNKEQILATSLYLGLNSVIVINLTTRMISPKLILHSDKCKNRTMLN
jgi:deoxycytidylate deaminase